MTGVKLHGRLLSYDDELKWIRCLLVENGVAQNWAMTKVDVTSIVWLVRAADWMIGAAAGDGVGVFAVPAYITAPVFLLVILRPVMAIAGTTVALV